VERVIVSGEGGDELVARDEGGASAAFDGFGDGRRERTAGGDGGRHVGRIFLEDDAEGFGLEVRDGGEGELDVDVLEEERGEEELRARRERRALDVVEENVAIEIVNGEAIAKAREKIGVDVGIGEAMRTEDFGIEEVEKLSGASPGDGYAGGGGSWAALMRNAVSAAAAWAWPMADMWAS